MKQRMLIFVLLLQLWRDVSEHAQTFCLTYLKRLHPIYIYIYAVPGPPTNPMAVPSTSTCNEVLFSWSPPPEDEQNGITHNLNSTADYQWWLICLRNCKTLSFEGETSWWRSDRWYLHHWRQYHIHSSQYTELLHQLQLLSQCIYHFLWSINT